MDIVEKAKKAKRILADDGLKTFFKECRHYLDTRFGPYRPDESGIAYQVLEADSRTGVMVDVGAHYGGALSPFAHSEWQIFAFEPDAENRKKLEVSFGAFPNVVIDTRAVSDVPHEDVVLYRSPESTGLSSLSSFRPSHEAGESVNVTSIAQFLDEQDRPVQAVDFLKIDTEGHDLQVLKGIPWDQMSPRLILCEFEDTKSAPLGYTFQDMADYLVEQGYRLIISEWYPIEEYGSPHDWRHFTTYPCTLADPLDWGNIFATKDDSIYDALLATCKAQGRLV